MTNYVYETIPASGEKPEYLEIRQRMNAPALTKHPENGKPIRRVILGGIGVLKSSASPSPASSEGGCCCGPSGGCD